ncbi:rhotekin isoform X4 [Thunnus albacares]|uniref:rhotekin isoform X3 n=1 Tax=Thunnus maccoyii TaxID=8240 RepID=UPI001C4D8B17|nr:rhotekin isoform X3 [Thunnus maccoyii]XP_042277669.1 rhotekin isoform X3 [Thunnus maccoyii]XP_044224946.1 rhotekin isoform X4 [Thunnus albacares]XP_044224957.1 rhotekin isoform X4 [Thunnus albacares]
MPVDKFAIMEDKLWILEDLNMMYIRQIALSLQDSDIQKKIDHEIRMRDGACKLLAACSQRDQALEAAKSLQTCSTRIMAYMSELQRMKEAQVMQKVTRRSSDAGPMDDRLPCKGKVAISDLRIPLMWKDTEYFKNKGELHRCAVFCLLQLGGEIFDTDMVIVDRTLTDICFDNTIVFSEASPGFELRVELYSCCSEDDYSAGSTPRKLASKLSSSLGRSAGKKLRAAMEPGPCSPVSNGGAAPLLLPVPSVPGPKYHLLAHTTLSLSHVQDSFRTHDLTISGNEECSYWLPLYGSMCCRLAAQPHCMTQQMMSGCLKVKQLGGDPQSWTKVYAVLKGTSLFCYHGQEDVEANVEPAFTIAINKETRIRAAEKDPHSKVQNICISNQYGGEEVTHTLTTDSREDTHRWMEAFWQHFYDMSQWKQCCDDLMKIELPSPRKPAPVTPKQGSLYHEMVIESSDDLSSTVSDILARRMQELELRSQLGTSPTWMSVFEENNPKSAGRPHPCTSRLSGHSPCTPHRLPRSPVSTHRCPQPGLLSSDASLTSDSDSHCSTSPCSHHHGWPEPSSNFSLLSSSPSRLRPRTLSLDAKLSTLRGRGYGGGGTYQCPCQPPPSSLLTPLPISSRSPLSQRSTQTTLSCSSSTSSNSSSTSEGSHSPESSEGAPFSRPSPARRSLRNLRARLDPRNWLQSQV